MKIIVCSLPITSADNRNAHRLFISFVPDRNRLHLSLAASIPREQLRSVHCYRPAAIVVLDHHEAKPFTRRQISRERISNKQAACINRQVPNENDDVYEVTYRIVGTWFGLNDNKRRTLRPRTHLSESRGITSNWQQNKTTQKNDESTYRQAYRLSCFRRTQKGKERGNYPAVIRCSFSRCLTRRAISIDSEPTRDASFQKTTARARHYAGEELRWRSLRSQTDRRSAVCRRRCRCR